ncbi:MAG: FAD-dependent monooxygenase [Cyclobacteriaceae bacterium]
MKERIAIVGAGIAGLATAIALQKHNYEVEVFEKSEALQSVGAGIILQNNGIEALKKLGVNDFSKGKFLDGISLSKPNGKVLMKIDTTQKRAITLFRSDLANMLFDAVKVPVHFGCELESLKEGEVVSLSFLNGTRKSFDYVIGCDGLHSKVARNCFAPSLRDYGFDCYRTIVDDNINANVLTEMWGDGSVMGYVPLTNQKAYFYLCVKSGKEKERVSDQDLVNEFDSYPDQCLNLLTEPFIHHRIIGHQDPGILLKDNIVLLGDAAHTISPFSGQGAGQGLEDAYYLDQLLSTGNPLKQATEQLAELRNPRIQQFYKAGMINGKIGLMHDGMSKVLRNGLIKMVSPFASRRYNAQVQLN